MRAPDSVLTLLRQAEAARAAREEARALELVNLAKDRALVAHGARSAAYAFCLYVQASALESRNDLIEAEDLYRASLHLFQETVGPDDPGFAGALEALALLRARVEPYPYGARGLEEALHATARSMGLLDPAYLNALVTLARYHHRGGDVARAREVLDAAAWTLRLVNEDGRDLSPALRDAAARAVVLATAIGDEAHAVEMLNELGRSVLDEGAADAV